MLFYNTLRHGMFYANPGASYYEDRYRQRVLSNLQRRAKSMGFVLQQPMEPVDAQAGVFRKIAELLGIPLAHSDGEP